MKGALTIVTDEWELMKKMRASEDWLRGNLVNSLTVAGIEKNMLSQKQRECPELQAVHLGKLAEAQGRDQRKALLDAEKERPGYFRNKKIDAVLRSLDTFELINTEPGVQRSRATLCSPYWRRCSVRPSWSWPDTSELPS